MYEVWIKSVHGAQFSTPTTPGDGSDGGGSNPSGGTSQGIGSNPSGDNKGDAGQDGSGEDNEL